MSYEEFREIFVTEIRRQIGEEYRVILQTITKNNGISRDAVSIARGENKIAPVIYIESFYENFRKGNSVVRLAAILLENYRGISEALLQTDTDFFSDYEKACGHIYCKLINIGMNREILKEIPYRTYLDLAVVYYYMYENTMQEQATILISSRHMELWGITEEELDRKAWENTVADLKPHFCPLRDIVKEYMEDPEEKNLRCEDAVMTVEENEERHLLPMYVLTNQKKVFGAICIRYPDMLRQLAEKIGGDFYILPSSVHECILVPADDLVTRDMLREMVTDINHTQVEPQEVLADQVYLYSCALERILF